MPRKRRQVAMKSSRAIQALRRLKNVHPDDLGSLEFLLASETSSLVRCHNHSFTVAMQKQMDIWYRHHVTTMRKLSHGQQSEYKNLMKVKNDKRRMYRAGVMRQRDELEFDIRMRAERERNEAEARLLNLTLDEDDESSPVDEEIDQLRKEADRSGWLRIRRQDRTHSDAPLPTIHDIDCDDSRLDSATTTTDQQYGDVIDHANSDTFFDGNSYMMNEADNSDVIEDWIKESIAKKNRPSDNDRTEIMRRESEDRRLRTTSNEANMMPNEATKDIICSRQLVTDFHGYEQRLYHLNTDVESTRLSRLDPDVDNDKDHRNATISEVVRDESRGRKWANTAVIHSPTMHPVQHDVREMDGSVASKHPVTELLMRGSYRDDPKARSISEVGEIGDLDGITVFENHEWGQTKRIKKIPSLHLQPIDQVTRYQREDGGRHLVGTVLEVKPSTEKFPMPSRRPQYHRRKALQWQVEEAPALYTKIQQFLSECDAVPRPASSLQTRPVIFFSRHNPFDTTSSTIDQERYATPQVHAPTKRSDVVPHDVEMPKRGDSVIRGLNVAATKEMVNRKHAVMTPHK